MRVYFSHPFGGKEKNVKDVERIIEDFYIPSRKEHYMINKADGGLHRIIPVSPIHTFGYLFDTMGYIEGLDYCLDLLNSCDLLVMSGDWENSRGCCAEYAYAKSKGITVVDYDTELKSSLSLGEQLDIPNNFLHDFMMQLANKNYYTVANVTGTVYYNYFDGTFKTTDGETTYPLLNKELIDIIKKEGGIK